MKNWVAVFGLLGGVCLSVGQDAETPDLGSFESFFHQVAQLKRYASGTIAVSTANGEGMFVQPTPKEVIGLTDEEAQSLNGIAVDFENKIRLYDASVGPLTFEARLHLVEAANVPENRTRVELRDLKGRRDRVILTQVDALRDALGELRFKVLEKFIQAKRNSGSFFPAVPFKN